MRCWYILLLIIAICSLSAFANDAEEESVVVTEDVEHEVKEISEAEDVSISYQSPYVESGKYYFADHFDDVDKFSTTWITSTTKKDDTSEDIAKYDGVWAVEAPQRAILKGDLGLVLKSKAKHAAIAARLNKPFVFKDKPFIVQYEVQLQTGQDCGGSYIKLLSSGKETTDLKQFNDKTPYTIMFGPDKCGNDIKLHFIFRHVNPKNKTISEKHCRKPKDRLEEPFKDKQPHLYQLVLKPDNTYTISVDHKIVNEGSLLTDFSPAVNPPKDIDDPTDIKPTDWDEREKINDPLAKKPEDWDEDAPPQIPDPGASKPDGWLDDEETMTSDPNAIKPADWDTDMDGEWEAPLISNPICEKAVGCGLWMAPLIPNPSYKGKWRPPMIDNPNYQGKWAPRRIPNPDFYEDLEPFKMTTIAAVGIELWSMSSDILFDNIIITDQPDIAEDWAAQTFNIKRKQIDKDAETFLTRIINLTNENPYLWAVYVIVAGLPLAFLIYYCCSSSEKDKPYEQSIKAKKTDEPLPDDEEEFAGHIGDGDSIIQPTANSKNKKSDLDEPSEPAEPSVPENEGEEEEEEDEEIENLNEEEKVNADTVREVIKKRKPRKE